MNTEERGSFFFLGAQYSAVTKEHVGFLKISAFFLSPQLKGYTFYPLAFSFVIVLYVSLSVLGLGWGLDTPCLDAFLLAHLLQVAAAAYLLIKLNSCLHYKRAAQSSTRHHTVQ